MVCWHSPAIEGIPNREFYVTYWGMRRLKSTEWSYEWMGLWLHLIIHSLSLVKPSWQLFFVTVFIPQQIQWPCKVTLFPISECHSHQNPAARQSGSAGWAFLSTASLLTWSSSLPQLWDRREQRRKEIKNEKIKLNHFKPAKNQNIKIFGRRERTFKYFGTAWSEWSSDHCQESRAETKSDSHTVCLSPCLHLSHIQYNIHQCVWSLFCSLHLYFAVPWGTLCLPAKQSCPLCALE